MTVALYLSRRDLEDADHWIEVATEKLKEHVNVITVPRSTIQHEVGDKAETIAFRSMSALSDDTDQLIRRTRRLCGLYDVSFLNENLTIRRSCRRSRAILKALMEFHSSSKTNGIRKRVNNSKRDQKAGKTQGS